MFIIKLVKMWLGGTPDMVVGTLKISSDLLLSFFFFLFCVTKKECCHGM